MTAPFPRAEWDGRDFALVFPASRGGDPGEASVLVSLGAGRAVYAFPHIWQRPARPRRVFSLVPFAVPTPVASQTRFEQRPPASPPGRAASTFDSRAREI